MFIETEQTPNPLSLKFLPGCVVMENGTLDFAGLDFASSSPLAKRMFAVEGVERVFFGKDFVTITQTVERDWQVMKPAILGGIMEHYTSGEPVVIDDTGPAREPIEDGLSCHESQGLPELATESSPIHARRETRP